LLLVPKEVFHIKEKERKRQVKKKKKSRTKKKKNHQKCGCLILPGLETDPFCPILPSLRTYPILPGLKTGPFCPILPRL
jgi:hypothetical protein